MMTTRIYLDHFTIICDIDDEVAIRAAYNRFDDNGCTIELRRALYDAGALTVVDEDEDE